MERARFGRAVRALRLRRGWRQADLGARAGLSRSVIGHVEQGQIERIAFADLVAIASALDAHLELDFRWRAGALDRLIDERHAEIVEETVRLFRTAGWDVDVEVSFSIYGERGSIDVVGRHSIGAIAIVEVKATVPEAGATVIGVDRKARLAPAIARERGWPCTGVARFLVVADSSTSRARIARHAATFRAAFPAGGRDCLAWIRDPVGPPPSGILFVSRNARSTGTERLGRGHDAGRHVRPRTTSPSSRR